MEKEQIPFSEIAPYVRWAGRHVFRQRSETPPRTAYDHRLTYLLSGSAELTVFRTDAETGTEKKTVFRMKPGDTALIRAGIPYIYSAAEPSVFLILNFDFLRHPGQEPLPLPMTSPDTFRREQMTEQVRFTDGFLENGCVFAGGLQAILPFMESIIREYDCTAPYFEEQAADLCAVCLRNVYRQASSGLPMQGRAQLSEILSYISEHFTEPIDNAAIAAHFHYNPVYVSGLIRARTGLSLHKYLMRLRVLYAADLLRTGNLSVGEAAEMAGFSDFSYFSQFFRRSYGCTPSAFRAGRLPENAPGVEKAEQTLSEKEGGMEGNKQK